MIDKSYKPTTPYDSIRIRDQRIKDLEAERDAEGRKRCYWEEQAIIAREQRDEARRWARKLKKEVEDGNSLLLNLSLENEQLEAQLAAANERAEKAEASAEGRGSMIGILEGQIAILRNNQKAPKPLRVPPRERWGGG